jgi:hypothetical protein
VGGVDVTHGGSGVNAEQVHQVHQVDRIGGVPGFIQYPVPPYLAWCDPCLVERASQRNDDIERSAPANDSQPPDSGEAPD